MNVMDLVQKSESQSTVILKTKILGIGEDMDRIKEKWNNSRRELENEIAIKKNCQKEIEKLKENNVLMERKNKELMKKLKEKSDELVKVNKYADEAERARRALDHRKEVDLDHMNSLKDMTSLQRNLFLQTQQNTDELKKKISTVIEQNEKTHKACILHESEAERLESTLKKLTGQLRAFQMQLEQFDSREEKYDQTINQLKARLKNALVYKERSDQQVTQLRHSCELLKDKLNQAKKV